MLDATVCFENHAGDMTKLLVLWLLVLAAVLIHAGTYGFTACPRENSFTAVDLFHVEFHSVLLICNYAFTAVYHTKQRVLFQYVIYHAIFVPICDLPRHFRSNM